MPFLSRAESVPCRCKHCLHSVQARRSSTLDQWSPIKIAQILVHQLAITFTSEGWSAVVTSIEPSFSRVQSRLWQVQIRQYGLIAGRQELKLRIRSPSANGPHWARTASDARQILEIELGRVWQKNDDRGIDDELGHH